MKIAVEGCCHGELDKIYETLAYIESRDGFKVDLLLVCGDFQAVRNESDLKAMAVPPKYQTMNSFYKYYSGEKSAPVLTIFIGGNHEASNYLQELPYGGWVAPNIYYLGYAGVVRYGGLRIAGLSGIYKPRDYCRGHFEHPPYNEDNKRSCYHIRNVDVFRLKQLRQPIDIFLSHDWPRGIYHYGNTDELLRYKKYFAEEIESGTLGSSPAEELLYQLQPDYWFAAHLHVKFAAVVKHEVPGGETPKVTKFLSLDKCLPNRQFLQILDIEPSSSQPTLQLELDREWLCILRSTNYLLRLTNSTCYMPGSTVAADERFDFRPTEAELSALDADFGGLFKVPDNFAQTVPAYNPQSHNHRANPPQMQINPQTTLLCDMVGLTNPFSVFSGHSSSAFNVDVSGEGVECVTGNDDDSLDVDDHADEGILDDDSDCVNTTLDSSTASVSFLTTPANMTFNPDEISLDDVDDDDNEQLDDKEEGSDDGASEVIDEAEPPTKRQSLSPDRCRQMPHLATTGGSVEQRLSALFTNDGKTDEIVTGSGADGRQQQGSDHLPLSADSPLTTLTTSETPATGYSRLKRRNLAIYSPATDSSDDSSS